MAPQGKVNKNHSELSIFPSKRCILNIQEIKNVEECC